MNEQQKKLRTKLGEMGPKRAIAYICSFSLREDEEKFLIEREIKGKSISQIARENHVSPETVKRRRKAAFKKMLDQIHI